MPFPRKLTHIGPLHRLTIKKYCLGKHAEAMKAYIGTVDWTVQKDIQLEMVEAYAGKEGWTPLETMRIKNLIVLGYRRQKEQAVR